MCLLQKTKLWGLTYDSKRIILQNAVWLFEVGMEHPPFTKSWEEDNQTNCYEDKMNNV
jgi:hypothetical protein